MKKIIHLLLGLFLIQSLAAQVGFSVSTDLSVLRSFTKDQEFNSFGQTVHANWHLKEKETVYVWISYFKGNFHREDPGLSIYSIAGLGLLSGLVENGYNPGIDTALYTVPQKSVSGTEGFKRLTVDLGVGLETELFPSVYLYGELRTWVPITDYPSPYLFNNDVPKVATAGLGLRVLFY